ncbi:MAG: hypothetical protein OHK0048_12270 [Rhodoferax sp.]
METNTGDSDTMRSDLEDFVTRYLSVVGAALMVVAFVAFISSAYDADGNARVSPAAPANPSTVELSS